jgi:excisionase family DNA binding protein
MNVLTVKEVAERLKVSIGCVYQLITERRLQHLRIGCGRGAIRIREDDLSSFLDGCRVQQHPRQPLLKHIRLGG